MLTYLRYTLATFCFAASVGCLALWWRSMTHIELVAFARPSIPFSTVRCSRGYFIIGVASSRKSYSVNSYDSIRVPADSQSVVVQEVNRTGRCFGEVRGLMFCPLWYPALVFALTVVGVLRFRRQFSVRSALICVSVVAALLGMIVAL
jgi:hypothetical protein